MQAVILVGGEGTRLRPLTLKTPKPMVPLFGIPFLERTIVRLRDAGVTEVVLAAGYLPEAIVDHFGEGARVGVTVRYVLEASPLGTAGALRNVADRLTGRFFVLNGDVLTSLDLRAMLAFHESVGAVATLHAIEVEDPSAFGCIAHDARGRVSAFVEKPPRELAPTNDINAGTYLLERRVLDTIPVGRAVSVERETFPALIAAGEPVYAFATHDYWLDVGRPRQYLQAHEDVLDRKLALEADARRPAGGTMWFAGSPGLPSNVRPPAYVDAGAAIDPGAVVGPHATIGAGCRIEAGAEISRSVLWSDVHVGPGARVVDAILATGVRVGREAVVSAGAVVGHGAEIRPGVVLENDARVIAAEADHVEEPAAT